MGSKARTLLIDFMNGLNEFVFTQKNTHEASDGDSTPSEVYSNVGGGMNEGDPKITSSFLFWS